jgi:hypothetical protein
MPYHVPGIYKQFNYHELSNGDHNYFLLCFQVSDKLLDLGRKLSQVPQLGAGDNTFPSK